MILLKKKIPDLSFGPDNSDAMYEYNSLSTFGLTDADVVTIQVSSHDSEVYVGDLYGLLEHLGVRPESWYLTCVLNEFTSSSNFRGGITELKLVGSTVINKITSQSNTSNGSVPTI